MPSGDKDRHEKSDKAEKTDRGEKDRDRDRQDKKSEKKEDKDREDRKERERDKDKEREKDKDKADKKTVASSSDKAKSSASTASASTSAKTTSTKTTSSSAPTKPGISEELLGQVAQQKYEAQEDKLKDVARTMMALLRDYAKLGAPEVEKKVLEIRKCLLKYEMQYLRVSELQEKRRREEIKNLEAEAARCRKEAEVEAGKIAGLHEVLDTERRRRKRYEGYENLAAEVNKKKTRTEYQSDIDRITADIADIRQQRAALDLRIDQRTQRAQLLRGAAAELAADLRAEQEAAGAALGTGAEDVDDDASPAASPVALPASTVEVLG